MQPKNKTLVITPTVGTKHIQQAIDSVEAQTYPTEHLIVVDGYVLFPFATKNAKVLELPGNTGHSKYLGHRIYAAVPLLVDADYVLFLDEDNWYEPDHVEKMVTFIQENDLQWCYSLRNIVDQDGKHITQDNCESLGKYKSVFAPYDNMVDTNCYCFKRKYLVRHAHLFYGNSFYQDRLFYNEITKALPEFDCAGHYGVNYRVKPEMYEMHHIGNQATFNAYKGNYPWTKNQKF